MNPTKTTASDALPVEEMRSALLAMGEKALQASRRLALLSPQEKNQVLHSMADAVEHSTAEILSANAIDMQQGAERGLSSAMLDRLRLDEKRIREMAQGLRTVASQSDPVGVKLAEFTRPNGLQITKISVPIGVIGIIFESRPNVTVDAAGICLKAGNTVILRGGKEAIHSNLALAAALDAGGIAAGLPAGAVQLIPWTSHDAVGIMLKMNQYIDLVIPRGGENLIRTVVEQATMPVIKHYKGVCHLYCDASCDKASALEIIVNAKCQRPSACNAVETLLIERAFAAEFIPELAQKLHENNVVIHGDREFCQLDPQALLAEESNFYREYLDFELNAKVVADVAEAIEHINHYGSHHSDGILSHRADAVEAFFNAVDSAVLYHNASTRFTDGGEFGMGAEIGISTDKLHARGPMGVNELVSYKYMVRGEGQIRK